MTSLWVDFTVGAGTGGLGFKTSYSEEDREKVSLGLLLKVNYVFLSDFLI